MNYRAFLSPSFYARRFLPLNVRPGGYSIGRDGRVINPTEQTPVPRPSPPSLTIADVSTPIHPPPPESKMNNRVTMDSPGWRRSTELRPSPRTRTRTPRFPSRPPTHGSRNPRTLGLVTIQDRLLDHHPSRPSPPSPAIQSTSSPRAHAPTPVLDSPSVDLYAAPPLSSGRAS